MKTLREKYGNKAESILKEVGKFQVKQALLRYKKLFEIEKLEKEKFIEFGWKIGELLGLGKFEVRNTLIICRNNPIALEYTLMLGKSDKPIDSYLCGIWEETYKALLGKEVEVKERNKMYNLWRSLLPI